MSQLAWRGNKSKADQTEKAIKKALITQLIKRQTLHQTEETGHCGLKGL